MTSTQSTRSIDCGIAGRLKNDRGFRQRFIKAWAQAEIATQVRALRKKRRLNQKRLAELVGTGQSAISRAEQADYDGWTFKTLVNLADGLDARLRVSFEPIEEVVSLHEEGERVNLASDNFVSQASGRPVFTTKTPINANMLESSAGVNHVLDNSGARAPESHTDVAGWSL